MLYTFYKALLVRCLFFPFIFFIKHYSPYPLQPPKNFSGIFSIMLYIFTNTLVSADDHEQQTY